MMDAATTFHRLVSGGFALSADGDRLTVRPADRLTDDLRNGIRQYKPILIRMLREGHALPSPQPAQGDAAERVGVPPPLTLAEADTIREAITERAAIIEYDAGATRTAAGDNARAAMRVYRYRLVEHPTTWLALIAPGLDPAEARRNLDLRFGGTQVLEVVEYRTSKWWNET